MMVMIACDQCVDGADCNSIFCLPPSTACGELWMGAQTYSLTLSQGSLYGCTTSHVAGKLDEPDSRRQMIPFAGNRFLAKHDRFSSPCHYAAAVETRAANGFSVEIHKDENASNPRRRSQMRKLHYARFHRAAGGS
jgi:hypothetical protein